MPDHKFTIVGDTPWATKVLLDDIELKGVTALRLEIDPGDYRKPVRLELDFIPGSIEVNSVGSVTVSGRDLP